MNSNIGGEIDLVEVGKRLKDFRRKEHWTQQKMASVIGYSVAYYSIIENGKAPNLNHRALIKIAKKLDMNPSQLIYGLNLGTPDWVLTSDSGDVLTTVELKSSSSHSKISDYLIAFSDFIKQDPNMDKTCSKAILSTIMCWLSELDTEDLETLIQCAEMQKAKRLWEYSVTKNRPARNNQETNSLFTTQYNDPS